MKTIEFALAFLIVPTLFQLIVGTLVLKKKVKLSLLVVSLISMLSTLLLLFLLFHYIDYRARQVGNHDGLWVVALFILTGSGVIVSLFIFLIQWLIQKCRKPTEAKD